MTNNESNINEQANTHAEASQSLSERFQRERLIISPEKMERLRKAHVALFGLGGVGSYVFEALVRAGIGHFTITDGDTVNLTNINRQLIALSSTVGELKTDAASRRALDINPDVIITKNSFFYGRDNEDSIDFSKFDYVADAIDSVSSKILIAVKCSSQGIPLISCMGTGNKVHPELLRIADISKTSVCPLARVMRYELRRRGINHLPVVFSTEQPLSSTDPSTIGSISFVPSVAGLLLAGKIIRDIAGIE